MTRARVGIVLLLVASWFVYGWLFPSDEAQIRGVLERVAENIGRGAQEGDVGRIARAAALRNDLDIVIVVDAGPPFNRVSGRDAIIGAAVRMNSTLRDLEISFSDVQVTVDRGRDEAVVLATAEAHYSDAQNARGIDARELEIVFRRIDNRWVISEVAFIRTLTPVTPQ